MRGVLSLRPGYYEALRQLTLQLTGIQLGSDHAFFVETRLTAIARREGFDALDKMIEELFAVGQSRLALQVVSALVERDTRFNRDPASLETLFEVALPDLVAKRGGGRIDLLCQGCGSGQDVYSLAIRTRRPDVRQMLGPVDLRITGMDLPGQALERAKAGRYTHYEIQRGLSARDMIANFTPDPTPGSTDWIAADALRANVIFEEAHPLSPLGEDGRFHAILFRGNLSRLSHPARLRTVRTLTRALKPHGYLLLGSDEDFGGSPSGMDRVPGHPNLYMRQPPEAKPVEKKSNGRTTFEGARVRRAAG